MYGVYRWAALARLDWEWRRGWASLVRRGRWMQSAGSAGHGFLKDEEVFIFVFNLVYYFEEEGSKALRMQQCIEVPRLLKKINEVRKREKAIRNARRSGKLANSRKEKELQVQNARKTLTPWKR
jgi:hypothetical protein